jgi:UDP-N-acetylmuramate dehydrogenase
MEYNIKQNESLAKYCTYKIGGPARCMLAAASEDEVIAALQVAQSLGCPFFVLGGGSNVLFADSGYPGMVIRMQNDSIEFQDKGQEVQLIVGAGTSLAKLVNFALNNSLAGLEWAAGIPGTVGGAIRGNAGAFHEEISNATVKVRAIEISGKDFTPRVFEKNECAFAYRDSVFKQNKNLVIVSTSLVLSKGKRESIEREMKEYLEKKTTTQPLDHPSAGSAFVNPPGFFAAKLIEDCGLKGKTVGGAQVSPKHANFIVNVGNAKAADVLDLIALIKRAVKEKFNIDLKEEIEIVA